MEQEKKQYQNDDHRLICALSPDLTCSQIARKFSISPGEVRVICKQYGVPVRDKSMGFPSSIAAKVKKMINENPDLMPKQIAMAINCTPEYVRKVRQAMGIKKASCCLVPKSVMQSVVAKIDHLRNGGMTVKEAAICAKTSPATYARYKKALG